MASFQDNLDKPVPEMTTIKYANIDLTNICTFWSHHHHQHPNTFRRKDALPVTHPTASKHCMHNI